MSLPPIREPFLDGQPYVMGSVFYRWMEGVERFIGTPPEEGSTGTVAGYDVGSAGAWVPLLSGVGTTANTWTGLNVFVEPVTSQSGYKVASHQVVGAQGAAVANAAPGVNAAAAPTQAEFNALVTQFNALVTLFNSNLARLRAHGLIAT